MFGQINPTPYDLRFEILGISIRVHPIFWASSAFLASELSHNRFFAGNYPAAAFKEGYAEIRDIMNADARGAIEAALAVVAAMIGLWSGRIFGRWLRAAVR